MGLKWNLNYGALDKKVSVRSLYDTIVTAFTKMEEFQLYQLFISDLRYQNDRKVLAQRGTKANCSFIRHSWSRFPLK